MNRRFKGFNLANRVPEELWTEIRTLYRRQSPKPPQRKRNARSRSGCLRRLSNSWGKQRSERQERKGKIYQLNAEFQRIARRDKKAFLSPQSKKQGNNRWERLEISSRKLEIPREHTQGWAWQKTDSKDLTEAEDIRKRWQDNDELYKKGLNDLDNHDAVVTHLEPDILECEVKWALGSITTNKTSGGDGIPIELFKILLMLLKCCTEYVSKLGKLQWPQDWKRSVFIQSPKKGNAKEYSNYHTIVLIPHVSKVMLKVLQARLQQYMNWELPEPEIKLTTFVGSWRKQGRSRKTTALLTTVKPLAVWITTNCGKFLKRWEYQNTLLIF